MYFDLKVEADGVHPAVREQLIQTCIEGKERKLTVEGYSGIAFNFNHVGSPKIIKVSPLQELQMSLSVRTA